VERTFENRHDLNVREEEPHTRKKSGTCLESGTFLGFFDKSVQRHPPIAVDVDSYLLTK
jgi:hypothetical protein